MGFPFCETTLDLSRFSAAPSAQRWSQKIGPVVKMDRMTKEVICNEETKEPFSGV